MRSLLRTGLLLAVATAACGKDAVGPKSLADPTVTTAQLASLDSIFASPVLGSFTAVSAVITPTSAPVPAFALAGALNPLKQSRSLRPYAERIEGARIYSRVVPAMSVSGTAALFPAEVVGKTFEWNLSTTQYEPTARTGASATGVRFILYAINELTGTPADPLVEVGYLDLIDESGTGNPKVHVIVAGVGGTPVYVNYTVTLSSLGATSARISSSGFITNGAASPDSVRFTGNITVTASSQTSVSVTEDVSLDVNSHDIHVRNWQRVTVSETTAGTTISLRLSFRFEHGAELVTLDGALDVNATNETVTGTFTSRVDGGLFATCNVTGNSTSFSMTCTGADEDGLNADEHAALDALGASASGLTLMFQGILLPAIGVIGGGGV